MNNIKRCVNKKLASALMAYLELNGSDIGAMCDPPVTRSAIHRTLSGEISSERLLCQITEILRNAAEELRDLYSMNVGNLFEVLFPCVNNNAECQENTEEYRGNVPGIGGKGDD